MAFMPKSRADGSQGNHLPELYQNSYNGYDRSIDLYVSRIRQKIEDDPASPHHINSVRSVGYQFVGTSDEEWEPGYKLFLDRH